MASAFRYSSDRPRVAAFLAIGLADLAVCLFVGNPILVVAYCLLSIMPKGMSCAFNHHHQHLSTFNHKFLNRALEFVYAFQSGATSHTWTLHHTIGHHLNYLDQTKDESRWARKNGSVMGKMEYSFLTFITAYPRAWKAGKNYPKYRAVFLRMLVPVIAAIIGIVYLRPFAGMAIFVVTPLVMLWFTALATYNHHSDRPTDPALGATTNVTQPFYNFWTGNLGFHTAHHHRPSAHWTKTPIIHASIASQIPADAYLRPSFPYNKLEMLSRRITSPRYRVPAVATPVAVDVDVDVDMTLGGGTGVVDRSLVGAGGTPAQ